MKPEENEKIKRLLWCNRHCCLCGKICGIDIEFAHLPGKEGGDINDQIPVCSKCHIDIGCYNTKHPKGTKYKEEELRKRREQIYEMYTYHLVPPINFGITQNSPVIRKFPDIGFFIHHIGNSLPVKASVNIEIFLGKKCIQKPGSGGSYYGGKKLWNLNPGFISAGHFSVDKKVIKSKKQLRITVYIKIIDQYEREHALLPMSWIYNRSDKSWFYDP